MGGICSTYGTEERRTQRLGGETTWEDPAEVGGQYYVGFSGSGMWRYSST
jgi:hypothetical protein